MFWYEGGMLFTDNLWQQSSQIWGQSMQWWEHWCKRYLNCGRDGVPPSFPVCPFRCGCQVTIKALKNDFLKFTVGESPYANPLCSCHSRLMRMRKRRVSHLPPKQNRPPPSTVVPTHALVTWPDRGRAKLVHWLDIPLKDRRHDGTLQFGYRAVCRPTRICVSKKW